MLFSIISLICLRYGSFSWLSLMLTVFRVCVDCCNTLFSYSCNICEEATAQNQASFLSCWIVVQSITAWNVTLSSVLWLSWYLLEIYSKHLHPYLSCLVCNVSVDWNQRCCLPISSLLRSIWPIIIHTVVGCCPWTHELLSHITNSLETARRLPNLMIKIPASNYDIPALLFSMPYFQNLKFSSCSPGIYVILLLNLCSMHQRVM